MPFFDDIEGFDGTALTDGEVNYVRRILRRGSTVSVPSAVDTSAACTALEEDECREMRALIEAYGQYDAAGEVILDGGADALKYDAVLERWGIRTDVRVLLGFDAEPRPASGDTLTQVLIELPTITIGEEA